MAILDIRCPKCERRELDAVVFNLEYPQCDECQVVMQPTWERGMCASTPEWGQSQFFNGVDQHFESRSEKKRWLKENNYEEAGDSVGGARNNDGFKGTKFSYSGQSGRG